MPREALAREAKQLIDLIAASPRPAGSEDEARSRDFCAHFLIEKGFEITEEDFAYSAFAGRWVVPLLGLLFLFWFVFVGSLIGSHPDGAVRAGIPFLLLLPALGYMAIRMVPRSRLMARRATNVMALRGERPRVWLVAHLDTKSQPVPMLVRIGGIVTISLTLPLTIVAGFAGGRYELPDLFWIIVCAAGAAGSIAMLLSLVGNRSQGAVDNASGVAAALLTASELPQEIPAAVLLTSAEELWVEGASAWIRDHAPDPGSAINFDGIDDVGIPTCMAKRRSLLAVRLRAAAETGAVRMRFRRVLPGIMVDASALERGGWDAVTLSKGDFSTLARIHTPADGPDRMDGTGVAEVVELVANFIKSEI